jgi:hypothetical protein
MEQAGKRLLALDAFRGATMALMVLVNTPGDGRHVYAPLEHAEWHGWTPTDVVFPSFMWIVGVAMTLSLGRRLAEGVPRARLLQLLSEGLQRKLTLISAPAGYGKSTILSQWLQSRAGGEVSSPLRRRPAGWLSLDQDDNDPARFWAYLAAALRTIPGLAGAARWNLPCLTAFSSPPSPGSKRSIRSMPASLNRPV